MLLLQGYPALASLDALIGMALYGGNSLLVSISQLLAVLGSPLGSLLLVTLFASWFYRKKDSAAAQALLAGMLLCGISNWVTKQLVNRPRPELEHLLAASGSSFPSGHGMSAFTLGFLLACLLTRHYPRLRIGWLVLAASWILLSGLGRLVLGVHYFSDVLAAYALAAALSCAVYDCYRRRVSAQHAALRG